MNELNTLEKLKRSISIRKWVFYSLYRRFTT